MSAKLVVLIESTEVIGRGVEDDPRRHLKVWSTLDGQTVVTRDEWAENRQLEREEQTPSR